MKPSIKFDDWPVSGKYGQDQIVINPRNVERLNATAPDNQQLQYVLRRLMNDGVHERGFPPLLMQNQRATAVDVVGGIHIPRHHGKWRGAREPDATPSAAGAVATGIESYGYADSATDPATAWSGSDSSQVSTARQDAAAGTEGSGEGSPFPLFAAIIIGVVAIYFFKRFDVSKAR